MNHNLGLSSSVVFKISVATDNNELLLNKPKPLW